MNERREFEQFEGNGFRVVIDNTVHFTEFTSGVYATQRIREFSLINSKGVESNYLEYCGGNLFFYSYDRADHFSAIKALQSIFIPLEKLYIPMLTWQTHLRILHEVGHFNYGFQHTQEMLKILTKLNTDSSNYFYELKNGPELETYKNLLKEEKFAWIFAINEYRRLASEGFMGYVDDNRLIRTSNNKLSTYIPPILEDVENDYLLNANDI